MRAGAARVCISGVSSARRRAICLRPAEPPEHGALAQAAGATAARARARPEASEAMEPLHEGELREGRVRADRQVREKSAGLNPSSLSASETLTCPSPSCMIQPERA
jgi:hypothetical protein